MAEKITASGDRWKLIDDGPHLRLQLHSAYGIVEVNPKTLVGLELLESIRTNYSILEAQGPIEAVIAAESEATE